MNLRKLNKIESAINPSKGLKKAKSKKKKTSKAKKTEVKKSNEKISVETTAIPNTEKVVEKTTNA